MSESLDYISVEKLSDYTYIIPEIQFFQGSSISQIFGFYEDDACTKPLDLSMCQVVWKLCPYGHYEDEALSVNAAVSTDDPHLCSVTLTYDQTKDLDMTKYTQQISVSFESGTNSEMYLRAEGDVIVRPKVQELTKDTSTDVDDTINFATDAQIDALLKSL